MISTSQKEHLTYTAIGQVLIILGAIMVIYNYVLPGFTTINSNLDTANAAIQTFDDTENNGLSFDGLSKILSSMKGKEELIGIINAASPEEVKKVIKKGDTGKYLTWLKQAITNSDEDRKKLVIIKQRINSILPTLSPMSSNIDEDNITLKQYIRFIEGKILKGFNFDSNIVLGLQGISYGDGKEIPKTIGTFSVSIDFNSTNANILKFITYVNNSGNGDILNETGVTSTEEALGVMSNPLITMDSISLADFLDPTKPNAENSGRATIRFYVRGSSEKDILYLVENIKTRKNALKKKIGEAVDQCKANSTLCGNLDTLQLFQLKYTEFLRSTEGTTDKGDSSLAIEKLSQQVTSLRSLEKEFEDIAPTMITTPSNN